MHIQIHPSSAHNKTIPAFMYVCHTTGSTFLSHPIHSWGDFCLEWEVNFLLKGDVYNSHHFKGFEAKLKVLVGGLGLFSPPIKNNSASNQNCLNSAVVSLVLLFLFAAKSCNICKQLRVLEGSPACWRAAPRKHLQDPTPLSWGCRCAFNS